MLLYHFRPVCIIKYIQWGYIFYVVALDLLCFVHFHEIFSSLIQYKLQKQKKLREIVADFIKNLLATS